MNRKRLLLPLLMAVVMMAMSPQRMWADAAIYLKPTYNTAGDPTTGIASWSTETATNVTKVTSSNEAVIWGEAGKDSWYYVLDEVTLTNGAVCKGNVHLILCNDAKLTVTNSDVNGAGIYVSGNNSLTIYAQSTGASMGELSATSGTGTEDGYSGAGIGGKAKTSEEGNDVRIGQNITINGGKVTAKGLKAAAGIGGVAGGVGKYIIINGGIVSATGQSGTGIGGGSVGANGEDITINGGTVTATGGDAACGIGGAGGAGNNITITGGTITATGGPSGGSGIGGNPASNISISGGTVTATGGVGAAGIGGGQYGSASNINITGGTITATAGANPEGETGANASAIGKGYDCETAASNITISTTLTTKGHTSSETTLTNIDNDGTDLASAISVYTYLSIPDPRLGQLTLTEGVTATFTDNDSHPWVIVTPGETLNGTALPSKITNGLRSNIAGVDDATSSTTITLTATKDFTLSFKVYCYAEGNSWDYCAVTVGDKEKCRLGNDNQGHDYTFTADLPNGEHTIKLYYRKDGGTSKDIDSGVLYDFVACAAHTFTTYTNKCDRCGAITEHTHAFPESSEVAANCTEASKSHCLLCGELLDDGKNTALNHDYPETYTDGVIACTRCHTVKQFQPATQVTAENYASLDLTAENYTGYVDYYAIGNAGQLAWFRDFVKTSVTEGGSTTYPNASANAVLTANIGMSPVCHAANTTTGATMLSWEPIGAMSDYLGTFDGNNKTITGLYVNGQSRNALFAGIGEGSKVVNLTVEGNVTGVNAAIIVSMSSGNAEITNCVSKGSVTSSGDNTAGVLGNGEGKVTYCTNYATVTSSRNNTGGVVGYNPLKVEHCVNHGDVIGLNNTGGVVGQMSTPTNPVSDCANYGSVTSNGSNINVGGIVGSGYSAIRCSNYGNVTAESTNNVGGIFGLSDSSGQYAFKECLNTGDIKGKQNVGGLVGFLSKNNNADSYSTGKVEAASSNGGLLIGYYYHDPSSALSNVYYVKGATVKVNGVETANQIQGGGQTINASQNVGKSQAEFASGEVCYLLNGSRSAGTAESPLVWYQAIGIDATPTFDDNQYTIVKYDATNGYYNDIENLGDYIFEDGTKYDAKLKRTATSLTYKRTFAGTTYNALYVPFAMQSADWSDKADIYRLVNIFENDKDDNGTIDEWVLKVVKLKAGESTKANTPYIIKPKQEGDMEITVADATLARAEENTFWCASTDYRFVFTGNYAEKPIDADSYFFISTAGGLQYAASDLTLKPQRWYMGIYDKGTKALVAPSTFNPSSNSAKAISIICEDEATGIESVNCEQLTVNNGKYLKDGRIVIVKNGKTFSTSGQRVK